MERRLSPLNAILLMVIVGLVWEVTGNVLMMSFVGLVIFCLLAFLERHDPSEHELDQNS